MSKPVEFKVAAAERCFDMITKMLPPRNLAEWSALVNYAELCVRTLLLTIERDQELSGKLRAVFGVPVREYFEGCMANASNSKTPGEELDRRFKCSWDVILTLLAIASPKKVSRVRV